MNVYFTLLAVFVMLLQGCSLMPYNRIGGHNAYFPGGTRLIAQVLNSRFDSGGMLIDTGHCVHDAARPHG
jgi:hypothetical protein